MGNTHTEDSINQGNKLIHKFMGKPDHIVVSLMKYHCKYDWILPVVDYIESLNHVDEEGDWGPYGFNIHNSHVSFGFGRFRVGDLYKGGTKIENIYNAVVGFVRWHIEKLGTNHPIQMPNAPWWYNVGFQYRDEAGKKPSLLHIEKKDHNGNPDEKAGCYCGFNAHTGLQGQTFVGDETDKPAETAICKTCKRLFDESKH